jgi:FKBP-type peptidyl-prolyl cis-trans isomerase FkpA
MEMMRPALRRATVALAVVTAACASGGSTPTADPLADARFAPALGVDLASMRRTSRGVYVRDMREGSGEPVSRGMRVQVRYTGWLADGTPFDSVTAAEAPIAFVVGRGETIAGWDEGIVGMRAGGRRQLVIPAALGYGAKGSGPIPPNATLVFTLDLVESR